VALRKDRKGLAVLVDALIFLVALTLLSAVLLTAPINDQVGDGTDLRSYHSVMLSGEMPGNDDSSMSALTLADYLMMLALGGRPLNEGQLELIGEAVNGTIAELQRAAGTAWLVIEIGQTVLEFGSAPSEMNGDVHADRRELGDASVVSTLFLLG